MKKRLISKVQFSTLFQIEKSFTPQVFRVGLILALIIYGTFGYLDYYAMPSNYNTIWIIRYAIITPLLIAAYVLSYYKPLFRIRKTILFVLLISGQLGIMYMIGISIPGDLAYYSYYAGLILLMLWACFVFRINFITTVFIALSTVLLYNVTAIFFQKVLLYPYDSNPWLILLNNNFFLIAAAILAIIGAYLIERQDKEIRRVHEELMLEKKELELAREKAEESDRLKSAFLANMSHEIRTPLNSIIGFSELLTDADFDQDQRTEFARMINENGNSLLTILSDIMDISKIEAGQIQIKKSKFVVKSLITEIQCEFLFKAKAKGIELKVDLYGTDETIIVNSDKVKIRQILINLISNALKFTHKGYIELGVRIVNRQIRFHVKDTGIGVSPEFQQNIFERFRQVESAESRKYGGTGLGLAISKSLIEMLGGEIGIESTHGIGSTFYFTLPME